MNRLMNRAQAMEAYQSGQCPVCMHTRNDHDGIGCSASVEGNICKCVLAQDMPGQPLRAGLHMPEKESKRRP